MKNKQQFSQIIYTKDALLFLETIPDKAKAKLTYSIEKSMYVIDNEFFKKLKNSEIWEFRAISNGIVYRLFSFWDTDADTLVVATHGIIKKTQKTPSKEIERAESIRKTYFEQKTR